MRVYTLSGTGQAAVTMPASMGVLSFVLHLGVIFVTLQLRATSLAIGERQAPGGLRTYAEERNHPSEGVAAAGGTRRMIRSSNELFEFSAARVAFVIVDWHVSAVRSAGPRPS
jgi:hypothetical protein